MDGASQSDEKLIFVLDELGEQWLIGESLVTVSHLALHKVYQGPEGSLGFSLCDAAHWSLEAGLVGEVVLNVGPVRRYVLVHHLGVDGCALQNPAIC